MHAKTPYNFILIRVLWIASILVSSVLYIENDYLLFGIFGSMLGFMQTTSCFRRHLSNDVLSPFGIYHLSMLVSWYLAYPFFFDDSEAFSMSVIYVFIFHLFSFISLLVFLELRMDCKIFNKNSLYIVDLVKLKIFFVMGIILFFFLLRAVGIDHLIDVLKRIQEIRISLVTMGMYYIKTLVQGMMLIPLTYFILLYARKELSNHNCMWMLVFILIFILVSIPLGSRALLIAPWVTLLISLNISRTPINFIKSMLPIIIFAIPLYLFVVVRTSFQMDPDTDMYDLMIRFGGDGNLSNIAYGATEHIIGRMSIIDNLKNYIENWDGVVCPFISIPEFLVQPIPRYFWADKPPLFNLKATFVTTPFLAEQRISETIGVIAEALYNGGIAGVCIFGLMYGSIVAVMHKIYIQNKNIILFQVLYIQLFLLPQAWITEGIINSSANSFMLLTVIINILFWLVIRKKIDVTGVAPV